MPVVSRARAAQIGVAALAVGIGVGVLLARRAPHPAGALPPIASPPGSPEVPVHFGERVDVSVFQRGNIHTHSTVSDGDHPPDAIYAWYRDHGYAFLALTDHNHRVDPAAHRHLERPGFVIIPGEEITMYAEGVPVHVNALCAKATIGGGPPHKTKAEALAWAVAEVKKNGGAALVNHPNFEWALTARDIPAARGAQLLEIWSGHPYVHTDGDAHHKSHEAIWDQVLTAGEVLAGVAVDDMHHLQGNGQEPAARPGRGWVEVFAHEASEPAICDALRHGRLYASSGAALNRIVVEDSTFSVWPSSGEAFVDFIGAGGEVLASARPGEGAAAVYRLKGDERYVRARVTDPGSKRAWTQAYRVAR